MLVKSIEAVLCPGMSLPGELRKLFAWIEDNGFIENTEEGPSGYLFDQKDLDDHGWTETQRVGGTMIRFYGGGNEWVKHWIGSDDPTVAARICVFADTGAEGSAAAFWLDDAGHQHIVHMGSGSGSTLCCVLGSAIDFLRLIAIGYDEVCWESLWHLPPNDHPDQELHVEPNLQFQRWVSETFSVNIPQTALEIVPNPAGMDDDDPSDPFCRWVHANNG